ncbi:3235_t:CDS:2, partial [Ambispora leptoticha]
TLNTAQKEFHAKLVNIASAPLADKYYSRSRLETGGTSSIRKETIFYPKKKYDPANFSTITSPNSRREVPLSCLHTPRSTDKRTGTVYNFLNSDQLHSPMSKLRINDWDNKSDDRMSNEILFNIGSITPRTIRNKNLITVYNVTEDNGIDFNNNHKFNNNAINTKIKNSDSDEINWCTCENMPLRLHPDHEEQLSKFPFEKAFEIIRFMKPFGKLDWMAIDWCALSRISTANIYDEIYKNHPIIQMLPKKASNSTWEPPKLVNGENDTAIIFSAVLEWTSKEHHLSLNPPKRGPSKRFYRKFGSDRFLSLKVDADLQKLNPNELEKLKRLLLKPIILAGRTFELLYGKDNTIFYFATRGKNIKKTSIYKLIDWHIPFKGDNLNMSVSKFVSRIALGLSDTRPTVIFQPTEIRRVKDVTSADGNHCLTDGCGAISLLAMRKVAEVMSWTETPCALQGRIGSAKGIWFLDPNLDISSGIWIELRESQVKFDVWCGDEDRFSDEALRTLDVVKVIKLPSTPGYLNTQYIRVLGCGGVEQEVFLRLVLRQINEYKSKIVGCNDPLELIKWIEENFNIMGMRLDEEKNAKIYDDSLLETSSNNSSLLEEFGEQAISSGFPLSTHERCLQLLQAGFTPQNCPYLAKELTGIMTRELNMLTSKFRIQVPLSRVLTCIADPTGTLNPGEIFIQLDARAGLDVRTLLPFGVIEGDVIVTRTPCLLPSDICKVRAVNNPNLSKYSNIVIFPIKTQQPNDGSLASRLSGGDYDGDTIFCCWEPSIVGPFRNSPILGTQSAVKDAILVDKTKIQDILSTEKPQISLQEKILDIHINDLTKKLNLYSHFHDLCVERYGVQHRKSIYFAQMCGHLVDALKQGLTVKENVFIQDSALFHSDSTPLWMMERREQKKKKRNKERKLPDVPIEDISHQSLTNTGFLNRLLSSMRELLADVSSPGFTIAPNATMEIDNGITMLFG